MAIGKLSKGKPQRWKGPPVHDSPEFTNGAAPGADFYSKLLAEFMKQPQGQYRLPGVQRMTPASGTGHVGREDIPARTPFPKLVGSHASQARRI
jgi:hypothetical protein